MKEIRIGMVGSGAMARNHASALALYPCFYNIPVILNAVAVASPTAARCKAFAEQYGFSEAQQLEAFWKRTDLDAVIIAGPNHLHAEHYLAAAAMPNVSRIYIEKPICTTSSEQEQMRQVYERQGEKKLVQTGFQFLQMGALRRALTLVRQGMLGKVIHFEVRYLHSGYLQSEYRDKRRLRLEPALSGGALADLGSHAASLLIAFLGEELEVLSAANSGTFTDVPATSDLCTMALLKAKGSDAIGSITASRISAGAGDQLELEIRGYEGAIRFSTLMPDHLGIFSGRHHEWTNVVCGNDYGESSCFPAAKVSAGWLRSLVHAHYLFWGGQDPNAFIPLLPHGFAVQRLLYDIVDKAGLRKSARSDMRDNYGK